jgi:hypothetical protein
MADTNYWICGSCGFVNAPHAFRRGEANKKCEQCGSDAKDVANVDVAPAQAVAMKVSAAR